MNKKDRVFVIGLDGATFKIIAPMVRQGKLPNFARLMREGAFGPLKSTMPPVTPCAWTSFGTGKDPSKHGLYDFTHHEGDPYNKKRVNRTFVKAKYLWRLLTEAGKRSIVIDVPLTYPPEEINGVLISRVMAPFNKNCAYPKSLFQTLKKKGWIRKPLIKVDDEHGANKANKEENFEKKRKAIKMRTFNRIASEIDKNVELAKWLLKRETWDFFMIVFMSADQAGHSFWNNKKNVRNIYKKLDNAVGELFNLAGENTVKFIMSDHGFTSIPYEFNINEWLHNKGILFKKLDIPEKESIKELKNIIKYSKEKRKHLSLKKFRYRISTDYEKSRAYLQSGTSYGVRINQEGRDKTGIVNKKEFNLFRDFLIRELKKLKHPATKKRIFSHILKKDDIYSKSSLSTDPSPDIFLLPLDMKVMIRGHFGKISRVFTKTSKGFGFHHTDGIFFAQGRDIKNMRLNTPKISDIMPTILHILDVPLPNDLDGRILREIFETNSKYKKLKTHYQGPSIIEGKEKTYTKEEEAKIKRRLEALGYIE